MAPTYWIIKVIWPERPFYLYRHIDMSWLARWQKNWFKTHEILSYNVTVIKTCQKTKSYHCQRKTFILENLIYKGGFPPFRNNTVMDFCAHAHCICTCVL